MSLKATTNELPDVPPHWANMLIPHWASKTKRGGQKREKKIAEYKELRPDFNSFVCTNNHLFILKKLLLISVANLIEKLSDFNTNILIFINFSEIYKSLKCTSKFIIIHHFVKYKKNPLPFKYCHILQYLQKLIKYHNILIIYNPN